jgi:hypothetical protein
MNGGGGGLKGQAKRFLIFAVSYVYILQVSKYECFLNWNRIREDLLESYFKSLRDREVDTLRCKRAQSYRSVSKIQRILKRLVYLWSPFYRHGLSKQQIQLMPVNQITFKSSLSSDTSTVDFNLFVTSIIIFRPSLLILI